MIWKGKYIFFDIATNTEGFPRILIGHQANRATEFSIIAQIFVPQSLFIIVDLLQIAPQA